MDRRGFVLGAGAALLSARLAGAAFAEKIYRIGIVSVGNNPRSAPFYVAFEQRLRELGWIDGNNLIIDFQTGETPAGSQISRTW
jgi:hypothetical protein